MTLVVDASVAIKWFVRENDSDIAERVLTTTAPLHAPTLLLSEFANGLWKNHKRNLISADQAGRAMAVLPQSINVWRPSERFLQDALQMALELDHPIYDMVYLAQARDGGGQVVTADMRFLKRVARTAYAPFVVSLTDWRPA